MRGMNEIDYMLNKEAEEKKGEEITISDLKKTVEGIYDVLDKVLAELTQKETEKDVKEVEVETNENEEIKEDN